MEHDALAPGPVGEGRRVGFDGTLEGDAVAQGRPHQLVRDAHHGRDCGRHTPPLVARLRLKCLE